MAGAAIPADVNCGMSLGLLVTAFETGRKLERFPTDSTIDPSAAGIEMSVEGAK